MQDNQFSANRKVKGVIVAAGYGSRFLPATKTVAKELFPIINRPAIDYIIEEFIAAGIEDILIISSRRKKSLEDYFDREIELENALINKPKYRDAIAPHKANIHFIRQQEMKGTGHALSLCQAFVGEDAFVVAYPDDIVAARPSLAGQLIDVYRDTGKSVLAVKDMPGTDVSRYGVVDPSDITGDNTYRIKSLIEKPAPGTEPSTMISVGRYLFTAEIFPIIDEIIDHPRQGEFYQTEIINHLALKDRVMALDFEGVRYDTGEPLGYIKTVIEFALRDPSLSSELSEYLTSLAQNVQHQSQSSDKPHVQPISFVKDTV